MRQIHEGQRRAINLTVLSGLVRVSADRIHGVDKVTGPVSVHLLGWPIYQLPN